MSSGYQKESFAEVAARHAQSVDAVRNNETRRQALSDEELRANQMRLAAVHREFNGVGQAQGAFGGQVSATTEYHDPQKIFTRAEVLAALRTLNAARACISEAITAFERME